MDQLLNPDFGVFALTIVNFLLLVWLLHKFAWKGIIGALERRENQIKEDKDAAAAARQEAQQLRDALEEKLQNIAAQASQQIQEAIAAGNTQKEQLLAQTQEQAARLLAQAKEQIEAEKNQALKEVREQIVNTALLAAAKITHQQVTQQTAQETVDEVLREINARK